MIYILYMLYLFRDCDIMSNEIKMTTIIGLVCNIFLFIIKIAVGLITKSQAMLADSINSGTDIFNSILTYIGNRISQVPSDEDHNLGHGKAEYIYSMLISIVMIMLGLNQIKSSIISIINNNMMKFNIGLIYVCIITIVVKFILYKITSIGALKYNNILLRSSSLDHRNDCFLTMVTLISCILSLFNIRYVDNIMGIVISIIILIQGFNIFKEAYDVLMDKTCPVEIKDKVFNIVKNHVEIKKTNHFNATPVGYRYQVSLSIFVDGNMSTFESHEVANRLEKEIIKEIDEIYLAVIHVNPM